MLFKHCRVVSERVLRLKEAPNIALTMQNPNDVDGVVV
jgi:hypothetical protein